MVGVSSVAAIAIIPLSWDSLLDDLGIPVCREGTLLQAPCKRKRVRTHVRVLAQPVGCRFVRTTTAAGIANGTMSICSQSHSVLPTKPVQCQGTAYPQMTTVANTTPSS